MQRRQRPDQTGGAWVSCAVRVRCFRPATRRQYQRHVRQMCVLLRGCRRVVQRRWNIHVEPSYQVTSRVGPTNTHGKDRYLFFRVGQQLEGERADLSKIATNCGAVPKNDGGNRSLFPGKQFRCHICQRKTLPVILREGLIWPWAVVLWRALNLSGLASFICLFGALCNERLPTLASGPWHLRSRCLGGGNDGLYKTCFHSALQFLLLVDNVGVCLLLIMKLTEHSGMFEAR